jgi:hypothetical protein
MKSVLLSGQSYEIICPGDAFICCADSLMKQPTCSIAGTPERTNEAILLTLLSPEHQTPLEMP